MVVSVAFITSHATMPFGNLELVGTVMNTALRAADLLNPNPVIVTFVPPATLPKDGDTLVISISSEMDAPVLLARMRVPSSKVS